MRVLVTIVTVLTGALLFWSYFGALHASADSFAVFRPVLAILFALLILFQPWPRRLRWPLVLLALAALAQVTVPKYRTQPHVADAVTLYQQNLLWRRGITANLTEVLRAQQVDLVTLQEVSARNASLLSDVADWLPYAHLCQGGRIGGTAIVSRYPIVEGTETCAGDGGLAAAQVATPGGLIWLVSIHLHWPWPYRQEGDVEMLAPVLESIKGPIIMAGDFNSVAWSHAVRRLAKAARSERIGPYMTTFRMGPVRYPLGIDHVLTSLEGPHSVHLQQKHGSDHHGVRARFTLPQP